MGIYINMKCYILHIFMTVCFLVLRTRKEHTILKSKKKEQYVEHILLYDHGIDILN